jgi:hypothetical protein
VADANVRHRPEAKGVCYCVAALWGFAVVAGGGQCVLMNVKLTDGPKKE